MIKNYLKGMVFLCSFALLNSTFTQTVLPVVEAEVSIQYAGEALSFLHYSPNLHHEHDGEHCLADVLTQDWIEKAGMEAEYEEQKLYQNALVASSVGGERASYTIPVIFHVIYNTPEENVSEAAINDLLDAVNEDFSASNSDIDEVRSAFGFVGADADIEFCLAKQDESGDPLDEWGIHRVSSPEVWFDPDTETNKMKGSTGGDTGTEGWDRDRYLNVWICDITNGAGFGVAGYAYKPTISALPPSSIDGIVIDTDLGMDPDNRVLTHEIGHFLGLDHTWGDGSGSCGTDDGLDDTPNTAGPSFDYSGSCTGSQETCAGTQTQYENYMDYSNCTVMFTEDQADLMSLILDNSRVDLTTSDACESVVALAPVADFTADVTLIGEGGLVNFTDLSENTPTSWSWTVTPSTGVTYVGGTSSSSENPTIQFANAGFYTIALTASNGAGSDTETKTDYIEVVVGGGALSCDTSRNYTAAEYDNAAVYGLAGEAGYYPAHSTLSEGSLVILSYAESFNAVTPTFVKRLRFPVFQVDDIGTPSNVTFTVWDDAGGLPSSILATQTVPLSGLTEDAFNIVDFPGGVSVIGNYWVGAQLSYVGGFDTLMFGTTNFSDRPLGPPSTTSVFVSGGVGWLLTSDLFTSAPNCSLIMDVLTSDNPSPVAIASFPAPETCEGNEVTMNGSGSLNTGSYYWALSDGTDDYFSDEANLTTSFDEGVWTIRLEVDGSCETDVSEEFTLTVNSPMDVDVSTEPENCTAEDGQITLTASGGDSGPFDYSINGGTTFFSSASFNDLNAGTYDYVVRDDENCEASGTATVANVNIFNPSISDDLIILPGESTNLTISGGVSWNWYEGADLIGSTSTITVSPDVTTTYICNVTDSDGCEAEREVTVTVDDGSGLPGIDLAKSVEVYPNPASKNVNVTFEFIEAKELTVTMVNVMGETVQFRKLDEVKQSTVTFGLDDMATGIYFITIETEHQTLTKKLVVRK